MISDEDAPFTYEYDSFYKIIPQLIGSDDKLACVKNGKLVPADFSYSSESNTNWMDIPTLQSWMIKTFK